jgi:hypothetical protein
MINIKNFYLKDIKGIGLILIAIGEDGNHYCLRDGIYSIIDVVNLNTIEKSNAIN